MATPSAAGLVLCAMVLVPSVHALSAAERVLFPEPLHITRELSDPVTDKTTVIDEYCHGNRVVSVSGRRTAIADYGKGEITEIDFAAGTYSITKFEQIARAHEKHAVRAKPEVEVKGGAQTLSRGAVEALMGIGYPHRADTSADTAIESLRTRQRGVSTEALHEEYRLPMEHIVRIEVDGETIETRNIVKRVGNELAPLDVLTIPPGAKLVESKTVAMPRLLEELDRTH